MGNSQVTPYGSSSTEHSISGIDLQHSTPFRSANGTLDCFLTPGATPAPMRIVDDAKCVSCDLAQRISVEDLAYIASNLGWPDQWVRILMQMHQTLIESNAIIPPEKRILRQRGAIHSSFRRSETLTVPTERYLQSPTPEVISRSVQVDVPVSFAPPPPPPPPLPPPLPQYCSRSMTSLTCATPKIKKTLEQTPQARVVITDEQLKKIVLRKVTDRPPLARSQTLPHLTPMVTLDQLRSVKLRKRGGSQTITSPTRSPISRDRVKKFGKSPARRPRQRPRHDAIPLSTILNFDLEMT